MSKIEKTLELNITHELLSLADSFLWYVKPVSLKRYWRPHWKFPFMPQPAPFATGLHINLEGKKGGGYDVCINAPSIFPGIAPRLLFMQFKAGADNQGVTNIGSAFSTSKVNPNPHIEFSINSNAGKIKQHKLLHDLASTLGKESSAVYVFPQIVTQEEMIKNLGSLLKKVLFISIDDIEAKAKLNGVTLLDNAAHKFRLCYKDLNKSEVNYYYFPFGYQTDPGGIIGEIFAVRLYRALVSLKEIQLPELPIYRRHLQEALVNHIIYIATYLSISPETLNNNLDDDDAYDFELIYSMKEEFLKNNSNNKANSYNDGIFKGILKNLSTYFLWANELNYLNENTVIPPPPDRYSIQMPSEGYRLDFSNYNYEPIDFEGLSYQLF